MADSQAYDQRQTTARGLGLQPEIAEDGQQAKPIQQGSAETVLQGRYLLRRFPEQTAALQIAGKELYEIPLNASSWHEKSKSFYELREFTMSPNCNSK